MSDIIFEVFRAMLVGAVLFALIRFRKQHDISDLDGWSYVVAGFAFIFFGMLIDITDNFEALNQYIIIGDTEYQAFLEKLVGYLVGFLLLAIGIFKWLPKIAEHTERTRKDLEQAENELKILNGLLPICATCKKIRDDQGYWNQLESYIEKHSDAEFSHGTCDKCADDMYGDQEWYKKSPQDDETAIN